MIAGKLCFLCMGKCSRQVTSFIEEVVQTMLAPEIDFTDSRVPQGLWAPCGLALRKKSDGESVTRPSLFKFNTITPRPVTRGTSCDCLICQIGKLKLNEKHPLQRTNRLLRVQEDKRCSESLNLVGKGRPHNCTQSHFSENMRFFRVKILYSVSTLYNL